MFATKILSFPPALKLDFPSRFELERLARDGLTHVRQTGRELTPVLRQASGSAMDLAGRATRQLTRLVVTQVLPLVENRLAPKRVPAASQPQLSVLAAAPSLVTPALSSVRRPGPLLTARLTFQL